MVLHNFCELHVISQILQTLYILSIQTELRKKHPVVFLVREKFFPLNKLFVQRQASPLFRLKPISGYCFLTGRQQNVEQFFEFWVISLCQIKCRYTLLTFYPNTNRYLDQCSRYYGYPRLSGRRGGSSRLLSVSFRCHMCGFETEDHALFQSHMTEHRQWEQSCFSLHCCVCGHSTNQEAEMRGHMETHLQGDAGDAR